MLRILKESDPEAVDFLLRRKAANHMRWAVVKWISVDSNPLKKVQFNDWYFNGSEIKK